MVRNRGITFSVEFKTKVVLELLEGEQTINQIASKYDVTAKSIQSWNAPAGAFGHPAEIYSDTYK